MAWGNPQSLLIQPLILLSIRSNWADDKTVALEKSLFFRVVLPLVLLENQKILEQHAIVETYLRQQRNHAPVPAASLRAQQHNGRSGRVTLDSKALAATLLAYSEQCAEYTSALQEMIDYNRLALTNELQLAEREPVYFDQGPRDFGSSAPCRTRTIDSKQADYS